MKTELLGYNESNVKTKKRKEILEKSMSIFIREGIHPLTMQEIAKECNISLRSLYYYYKTKDDLAIDIQISLLDENWIIPKDFNSNATTAYELMSEILEAASKYMLTNQKVIKYITAFDYYFHNEYPDDRYKNHLATILPNTAYNKVEELNKIDDTIELYDEDLMITFATVIQSMIAYAQRFIYREKAMLSEEANSRGSLEQFTKMMIKALKK